MVALCAVRETAESREAFLSGLQDLSGCGFYELVSAPNQRHGIGAGKVVAPEPVDGGCREQPALCLDALAAAFQTVGDAHLVGEAIEVEGDDLRDFTVVELLKGAGFEELSRALSMRGARNSTDLSSARL